jgi:hypothetical protein
MNWREDGVVRDFNTWAQRVPRFLPDNIDLWHKQQQLNLRGILLFDASANVMPAAFAMDQPEPPKDDRMAIAQSTHIPRKHNRRRGGPKAQPLKYEIINEGRPDTTVKIDEAPSIALLEEYKSGGHRLPRFMEWLTHDNASEMQSTEHNREYTERILHAIHDTLLGDGRTPKAATYRWVREATWQDLFETYQQLQDNDPTMVEDIRFQHLTPGRRTAAAHNRSTLPKGKGIDLEGQRFSDTLHTELFEKCNETAMKLYKTFNKILDCYVSTSHVHLLFSKTWGALQLILKVG